MKKFVIASAVAAMIMPSLAFAQEATPATGMQGMSAPAASDYTIEIKTNLDVATGTDNTDSSSNRNTDPAAIQRTIDANPGLAEKLASEGVKIEDIGNLSVQPGGKVVVYKS